jgi:hypothetical protein
MTRPTASMLHRRHGGLAPGDHGGGPHPALSGQRRLEVTPHRAKLVDRRARAVAPRAVTARRWRGPVAAHSTPALPRQPPFLQILTFSPPAFAAPTLTHYALDTHAAPRSTGAALHRRAPPRHRAPPRRRAPSRRRAPPRCRALPRHPLTHLCARSHLGSHSPPRYRSPPRSPLSRSGCRADPPGTWRELGRTGSSTAGGHSLTECSRTSGSARTGACRTSRRPLQSRWHQ